MSQCPSCLIDGFNLVAACSFCGVRGCEMCIYDGDAMYNAPTCCAEAAAMNGAWWALPAVERSRYPRGARADETSGDEARALLGKMSSVAS